MSGKSASFFLSFFGKAKVTIRSFSLLSVKSFTFSHQLSFNRTQNSIPFAYLEAKTNKVYLLPDNTHTIRFRTKKNPPILPKHGHKKNLHHVKILIETMAKQ